MNINPLNLDSSDFSSSFLLGNIGIPFAVGLAVGFFVKKMLKIVLYLCGALVVMLFATEYYGITHVSNLNLQTAALTATTAIQNSGSFLMERLSLISGKGASAATGFLLGLKLG